MMKQRWQLLIPLVIFIGLIIFLWRGLSLDPHQLPSPFINKPVQHFVLPDLLHFNHSFSDQQLHGQVALLNVWATWCISCHVEHPVLVDIAGSKAVAIYSLNYKDSPAAAKKWLQNYGNPYQAIGDDRNGNVAIDFGVYGTPETFVIDKHGIIRYKYIGPITQEVWQNELKPEVDKLSIEK